MWPASCRPGKCVIKATCRSCGKLQKITLGRLNQLLRAQSNATSDQHKLSDAQGNLSHDFHGVLLDIDISQQCLERLDCCTLVHPLKEHHFLSFCCAGFLRERLLELPGLNLVLHQKLDHHLGHIWISASLLAEFQQCRLIECKQCLFPCLARHLLQNFMHFIIFPCRINQFCNALLFANPRLQALACTQLLQVPCVHGFQLNFLLGQHLIHLNLISNEVCLQLCFQRHEAIHHGLDGAFLQPFTGRKIGQGLFAHRLELLLPGISSGFLLV